VIAHIEASFSGFGTCEQKNPEIPPDSIAPVERRSEGNTALAGRLVGLSLPKRNSDDAKPEHKKRIGPYVVATLAGFTVLALTASLAWIVHGQRPFETRAKPQDVRGAEVVGAKSRTPEKSEKAPVGAASKDVKAESSINEPSSPLPQVPDARADAQKEASSDLQKPTLVPSPTEPGTTASQSSSKARAGSDSTSEGDSKKAPIDNSAMKQAAEPGTNAKRPTPKDDTVRKQKTEEATKKEPKRQVAKASPDAAKQDSAPGYPIPQAIRSDGGQSTPSTETSRSMSPSEKSSATAPVKQAASAEPKPREAAGSVEALCSDRSNFITRGFCQSQYCTEPQRQSDSTCQRLRQHEAARKSVNY
jgi:hypothetical protein